MNKLKIMESTSLTNREKEAYRTLRTNVMFTGIENKALAITSCVPNDGKTTVSFQLACALAEDGKLTLYIDADLRKSVFINRYDIKGNPKGLAHWLSGQEALNDVMYKTNIEHLYVMPVGAYPSNPTELLNKERFSKMIEEAKNVFDYVIVDTPPLGSVIDAAIIAKYCDASMLVLESDNCSRSFAKSVIAQLKSANPNFLGVVLNKVEVKKTGYYGKKYGRYYSYDSYYGQAE